MNLSSNLRNTLVLEGLPLEQQTVGKYDGRHDTVTQKLH